MKLALVVGFGFLLFLSSQPAMAARIVVGGPGDPDPAGLSFEFTSNASGGGFFPFYNNSGVDWVNLLIQLPEPISFSSLDVTNTRFVNTELIWASESSIAAIFLHGVSVPVCGVEGCFQEFPGIPYDPYYNPIDPPLFPISTFFIGLNNAPIDGLVDPDPEGDGDWGPNKTFHATANVPEPATLVLLLGGLAVMGLSSLRRKRN